MHHRAGVREVEGATRLSDEASWDDVFGDLNVRVLDRQSELEELVVPITSRLAAGSEVSTDLAPEP